MKNLLIAIHSRFVVIDTEEPDRGDVPGWVMVTLMTAMLVVGLWTVAEVQLKELFSTAISNVLNHH